MQCPQVHKCPAEIAEIPKGVEIVRLPRPTATAAAAAVEDFRKLSIDRSPPRARLEYERSLVDEIIQHCQRYFGEHLQAIDQISKEIDRAFGIAPSDSEAQFIRCVKRLSSDFFRQVLQARANRSETPVKIPTTPYPDLFYAGAEFNMTQLSFRHVLDRFQTAVTAFAKARFGRDLRFKNPFELRPTPIRIGDVCVTREFMEL